MSVLKRISTALLVAAAILLTGSVFNFSDVTIFLPGTQPGDVQSFESPAVCQSCHQTGVTGPHSVSISNEWKGSMMAHSARDPLFYAALAVANKYDTTSAEFCIRCHSPTGWLEGRHFPPTGQGLTGNDLNGVQCDLCHRMKDPLLPDSLVSPPVPGYGNAMMVVQSPRYPKRGPFTDAFPAHQVLGDSFQKTAEMCGVCHDVSNPRYATDPVTQPPHSYASEQRTFSEWKLSWYATQGESGTCQACHMAAQQGFGCTMAASPKRFNVPRHDMSGGNTFVPDILKDFWSTGIDTVALEQGKQRSIETLRDAAVMAVDAYRDNDTVRTRVRITNLTGHKLPTGYPEGRRMWLNIVGTTSTGDTVFQSGSYDYSTADLIYDSQIKVYETRFGLTSLRAAQYGLPAGASFHLSLNDTLLFDNRIPPFGFYNAAFATHLAQPVGYSYADGQFWDYTSYLLPDGVTSVTATLLYQTASKEYIQFLRDENVGNSYDWRSWGDSLYSAWNRRGKSTPVAMNTLTVGVTDSSTGFEAPDDVLPSRITLAQNYPNPFNPSTTIEFTLGRSAYVTLHVFDIGGRQVATLVDERLWAGSHRMQFNGTGLSSGMYLYRLSTDNRNIATRKMIFAK